MVNSIKKAFMKETDLQKMYPEYTKNDFILWLVYDVFFPFQVDSIDGTVTIMGFDDNHEMNYKIRTPYSDSSVYQISMKNGKKTSYGIPLVFKTIAELRKVKAIKILFNIKSGRNIYSVSVCTKINNEKTNIYCHDYSIIQQVNAGSLFCEDELDKIKDDFGQFDDVYIFNSAGNFGFLKAVPEHLKKYKKCTLKQAVSGEKFDIAGDFFLENKIISDRNKIFAENFSYENDYYQICCYKEEII